MSRAAKSLFAFGVYLIVLGMTLVITPNFVLLGFAAPALLLFGAADRLAAVWTAWAIRRDGAAWS